MDNTTTQSVQPARQHWFGLAYLLIFVAGVGFFLLSFFALGVVPGLQLSASIASRPQTDMPNYTAAELRGRHLYTSLGCALCHTQQVRFILPDVLRWGAPTEAWETRYDFPHLWGTRRIGPDLARESNVRSDDWQFTHLYRPQSIVPDSVMPSFEWLFNGSPDRPTVAATDLLAYLQTLGRARATGAGKNIMPFIDTGLDPAMMMEVASLCTTSFIHPNQTRVNSTSTPDLKHISLNRDQRFTRGSKLFAQNCAGCHGANGDGLSFAATGLSPKPANLQLHRFSTEGMAHILWNGVAGSAMPAWRDFSSTDLASIITYVQALHPATGEVSTIPASVLTQGAVIYAKNCISCHGAQGEGNGVNSTLHLPRPENFTLIQPDAKRITQVLDNGIPGTSMPPWPSLTPMDKQAVSAFVRTLFKPTEVHNP